MNLADSSTLAATMATRGYRRVAKEDQADLIIFNTCSVREKAEERVFGRLGEIYKFKRKNPNLKVAVVGCMAQRLGEEIHRRVPYVDYVLGTDRLFELPDVLEGVEGTEPIMTAFGHENMDMIAPIRETDYSGFITISRGCDNFCTYCIVPFVRGRERGHSDDHIVDSAKKMAEEGVVELTLLGQNVNSYRFGETDFPKLLERVVNESGVPRIRFMTSHPKDLSKRLVDVIAAHPERLLPHIHLPLQSGSNRILQMMGRIYTVEHYLKIVDYIRTRLEYVALTTDLIVGFPTETEEEYEETLDIVSRIRYDSAFMFRYSVRPGTAAERYEDDVPEDEKISRLKRLIKMQQQIGYEVNQREIGRLDSALVEGLSRRNKEIYRARTTGNKTVLFTSGQEVLPGSVRTIRITAADAFTLHGELTEAD